MLYLIGLGFDEKDASLKALAAVKKCRRVFAEFYTSPWRGNIKRLEKIMGKKIKILSRSEVEEQDIILKAAKKQTVAFLVPGDPLIATTHADLVLRARQKRIKVAIIHSVSIFSTIAETGLQIYKFGPTVSLPKPRPGYFPTSPYEKIEKNLRLGWHTLVLLDVGLNANAGMEILLRLEKKCKKKIFSENTRLVVAARLGSKDSLIKYGQVKKLLKKNFGPPPHTLVIPGKLHFAEKEFLKQIG